MIRLKSAMQKIAIIALPGVLDSALHIVRDVLAASLRLAKNKAYSVKTLSVDGRGVKTSSGQVLRPDGKIGRTTYDLVVVPGVAVEDGKQLIRILENDPAVPVTISWIERQYRNGAHIAAACTGTWIVAEAGLLDGRTATTTWHLATEFSRRYPDVQLQLTKMVTVDGRIRCAGAAMAHMDLALAIVSAVAGAEVARHVASHLLIDRRPSQARYMVTSFMDDASEDFRKVDAWIRSHVGQSFSINDLAHGVGISARTLARRIRTATGATPTALVQRIRVEQAIYLLETTSLAFSEITDQVGYAEPATLRRLIRKQTQRTPSSFR